MRSPTLAVFRNLSLLLTVLVSLATASGCSRGDVGAPCDHSSTTPPQSLTVSFPALSCNELTCVYGDDRTANGQECEENRDCGDEERFLCNQTDKTCELNPDFVLRNSMCSRPCESASDCDSQGFSRFRHKDTNCKGGFACRILQSKGRLCCQKLCVCKDYMNEDPSNDLLDQCKPENNPACENIR